MKRTEFTKRMNWSSTICLAVFILYMFYVMPTYSAESSALNITVANYITLSLTTLLLIMLILSYVGFAYYRLIIEEDRIIEKRLFRKTRILHFRDVRTVTVSLRGIIKVVADDKQITICCMKDPDALWWNLKEKFGEDKIEFAGNLVRH